METEQSGEEAQRVLHLKSRQRGASPALLLAPGWPRMYPWSTLGLFPHLQDTHVMDLWWRLSKVDHMKALAHGLVYRRCPINICELLLVDKDTEPVHTGWWWLRKLDPRAGEPREGHLTETSLRQWEGTLSWKPTRKLVLPRWSVLGILAWILPVAHWNSHCSVCEALLLLLSLSKLNKLQ